MVGPPYNLMNVGGDVAWQMGGFGAAFVALMSMFFVGRHTRQEEQSGRSELVGAAPVGRFAPVAVALVVVDRRAAAARRARRARHDRPRPAGRRLARARRLAGRRRARVRRRRRGRGAGQPDDVVDVRASPAPRSAAPTCCAPRATSATARCRGCRRSAGASTMRPYADERWWPLALMARRPPRASCGARSRCARAATRARASSRQRPGPATARAGAAEPARARRAPPARRAAGLERRAVPQRRLARAHRPRRRQPARRQRRDREAPRLGRAATSSTSTSR